MTISQDKRYAAEAAIIKKLGKVPSIRVMQAELAKQGIKVAIRTVQLDLQKDLESLSNDEYKNQKEGLLGKIDEELTVAHNIAISGTDEDIKLKAMRAVTALAKTKADILAMFKKAEAEINAANQPKYYVFIGQANKADIKKLQKEMNIDVEKHKKEIEESTSSNQ